jgi:hypothetical protein
LEAAAAAGVEDIQKEEWDLDAIEKRKEQQVRTYTPEFDRHTSLQGFGAKSRF